MGDGVMGAGGSSIFQGVCRCFAMQIRCLQLKRRTRMFIFHVRRQRVPHLHVVGNARRPLRAIHVVRAYQDQDRRFSRHGTVVWLLTRRGIPSVIRRSGTGRRPFLVHRKGSVTVQNEGNLCRFTRVRFKVRNRGVLFRRVLRLRRNGSNLILVIHRRFSFLNRARKVSAVELRRSSNGVEASKGGRR